MAKAGSNSNSGKGKRNGAAAHGNSAPKRASSVPPKRSGGIVGRNHTPMTFTIRSDFAAGHDVQKRILDAVEAAGFNSQSTFAIKLALDTTLTPRPMSHDLIKSFMEHLNVTVRRIVIGDVKNSTYYASVYLENNGVERMVDARPSDAVSLALRTRAPLYITEDVLARRNTANLESWLAKQEQKNSSTQQQEVQET